MNNDFLQKEGPAVLNKDLAGLRAYKKKKEMFKKIDENSKRLDKIESNIEKILSHLENN